MRPLALALAIAIAPLHAAAQTARPPIPLQLAGFRLGDSSSVLPSSFQCAADSAQGPDAQACLRIADTDSGVARTCQPNWNNCRVADTIGVDLLRGRIFAITWSQAGHVGNSLDLQQAWNRFAGPMISTLGIAAPDTIIVLQLGVQGTPTQLDLGATGAWNPGGLRVVIMTVTKKHPPMPGSGTDWTLQTTVGCGADAAWPTRCVEGPRPRR